MTKEALELALEALEEAWYHVGTFQPTEKAIDLYNEARTVIKEALAQPEQEPVAGEWIVLSESVGKLKELGWNDDAIHKANTPQRKPLTENEIKNFWYDACQTNLELTSQLIVHLARNIEAAHGIKE